MMKKLVILISGKMRSGKNQFSEFLKEEFLVREQTVSEDMFAKGVKDGCREDFKDLAVVLNKIADETGNEDLRIVDENWYENKTAITRAILQIYGTQIFRWRVADDWWIRQLKSRILASSSDVILVTDVRFPNEIEGIYSDNGEYDVISIRVNRNLKNDKPENLHASETSLDDFDQFQYVVDNFWTLEDLKESAKFLVDDIELNRQKNIVENILI